MGLLLLTAVIGQSTVSDPGNHIVLESVILDSPGDRRLQIVPPDVSLIAGLFDPLLLTGVVEVLVSGPAGAGEADHRALAFPTKQFPGQQVVAVDVMPALWIPFRFQHLLNFEEQLIADDAGDAALNTDIIVDIDAPVTLVEQHSMETALSPGPAPRRPDPPGVEVICNVDERLPAGYPAEDLPHDVILGRVQRIAHILPLLVAVGQVPVGDLAVLGVVPQAASDILGHVLAVELVDVHHGAEGKAPRRRVVEVLLRVEDADAKLLEPRFIDHGLEHIPAHAVGLPGDDILKFPLLRVLHHLLEVWPPVSLAGDGPVCVDFIDWQAQCGGVGLCLTDLLFNAGVLLGVTAVPGVDDAAFAAKIQRLSAFWLWRFFGPCH